MSSGWGLRPQDLHSFWGWRLRPQNLVWDAFELLKFTWRVSRFNFAFMHTPFSKILVKSQNQASASDHSLYDIFDPQKVPLLKTSDEVIACDLWFELPQLKFLAMPMVHTVII